MISQFFVLSARGDTIINRDFRQDLVKNTPEIFFREVKLFQGEAPPIFNIEGVSFVYLKKSTGLYLVMTTRSNVAPSFITEVLNRLAKIIKDFCGTLTEESIRKNFILIYEILDEFMVSLDNFLLFLIIL
jgi:AP-4 complex subunit mu-1